MSENKSYSIEEARGIAKFMLSTCEAQNRKFTAEEEKLYNSIVDQLKAAAPSDAGRKTVSEEPHKPNAMVAGPTGSLFKDPAGNRIQAYRIGDRFCQSKEMADEDIGAYFRARLLGDKDRLPKSFRNAIGTDPNGSPNLIPTEISQKVWDLARAASVVSKAGVQSIGMHSSTMNLITVSSGISPSWRGTTPWTKVPITQPGFDKVELKIFSIGALCGVSWELLEDGINAEAAITQTMQNAVSTAIDQAVLGFGVGTAGVDRPEGICDSSAVFEYPASGLGIGDYNLPVMAIRHCLEANHPGPVSSLSWLGHPAIFGTYQLLAAKGSGQYLEPPPWVREMRQFSTTTLTNGTTNDSPPSNLYQSVYWDFNEAVIMGVRPTGISFDTSKWGEAVDANNAEYSATQWFGILLRI